MRAANGRAEQADRNAGFTFWRIAWLPSRIRGFSVPADAIERIQEWRNDDDSRWRLNEAIGVVKSKGSKGGEE